MTHRDMALFLLRKNTKFNKTRETAKKYPAKFSFLENSYRKGLKRKGMREWNHQASIATQMKWKMKILIQMCNESESILVQAWSWLKFYRRANKYVCAKN